MSGDALNTQPTMPVTVVGGYLGAGKTTLVNHLLRQANGLRLAILVNDFGDLPIDADLIENQDENVISISGGCVCCSFGSDLIGALIDLRNLEPRPDHLLIEASGVALPGAIAESVSLLQDFKMDSIVVLADAETVQQRSREKYFSDTINRQLTSADLIVLNKCDLPGRDDLSKTETWLRNDFPNAACLCTQRAELPLCLLTEKDVLGSVIETRINARTTPFSYHPGYVTSVLEFPKGRDPNAIAAVLAHEDSGLLRAKGHIEGADGEIYTVQTVGRRSEVRRSPVGVGSVGRVVLIAPDWHVAPAELADALGGRVHIR
ncbi:MAG: GTP-binding protein [Pseudomonadota bacterium]